MKNKDLQEDKYICLLQENLSYNNIFTNIQRFFVVRFFLLGDLRSPEMYCYLPREMIRVS
jgi:hypothetical protein